MIGVDDAARARAATARLLGGRQSPTAIFAAQDRITAGALAALHDAGCQHHVALFGYDDIPFADQLDPSVSLIEQDPRAMGRRAGELLVERLGGRRDAERVEVLPAPLCHRVSGNIRP